MSFFGGSPKRTLFDEKRVLTVGDKTPESGHESSSWEDQDLMVFVVLFDITDDVED